MTMLTWKKKVQKYGDTADGHLGKIHAFAVFYNSLRSQGDTNNSYAIAVLLPGFKETRYYANTEEDAKAKAEKMCNDWIIAAGLVQEKRL